MDAIVNATLNLAADASGKLILISCSVAGLFGAWAVFRWYIADENEKPARMKTIKGIIIGAVAVVCIEAFLGWVFGYYMQSGQ